MKTIKKSATEIYGKSANLLFFLLLGVCDFAYAIPIDPLMKDVSHLFSRDINNSFYLYADNKEDDLVWYISRDGKIAMDNTGFDSPEFDIGSIYSDRSDFFFGEELVWMEGAFDTTGEESFIQLLREEANQKGYRIKSPKPKSVTTSFMISGIDATELNLDCSEFIKVNNLELPLCFVINETGEKTPADFISMFRSKLPEDTLTKYVGFHGLTTPGWVENMKDLMGFHLDVGNPNAGQNWADKFQAVATWELEAAVDRQVALAAIDWPLLIANANVNVNANNFWKDSKYVTKYEVDDFYRQVIKNSVSDTENKGLKLSFTSELPNLRMIQAEVAKLFKNRVFFTKMRYVNPDADLMPDQAYRYVKRWIPIFNGGITVFVEAQVKDFPKVVYSVNQFSQNLPPEKTTFEYGPDTLVNSPRTILAIECFMGGGMLPSYG